MDRHLRKWFIFFSFMNTNILKRGLCLSKSYHFHYPPNNMVAPATPAFGAFSILNWQLRPVNGVPIPDYILHIGPTLNGLFHLKSDIQKYIIWLVAGSRMNKSPTKHLILSTPTPWLTLFLVLVKNCVDQKSFLAS